MRSGYSYKQTVGVPALISMLRIGRKYQIAHLRQDAILQLKEWFPFTLEQARKSPWFKADTSEEGATADHPARHEAIALVNVLQECDAEVFLPQVFYCCAQLDVDELVKGITDSSGHRWELSRHDLARCLRGRTWLRSLDQDLHISMHLDTMRKECSEVLSCIVMVEQGSHLKRINVALQQSVESVFNINDSPWQHPDLEPGFCSDCREYVDAQYEELCDEAWHSLAQEFDVSVEWPVVKDTQDKVE